VNECGISPPRPDGKIKPSRSCARPERHFIDSFITIATRDRPGPRSLASAMSGVSPFPRSGYAKYDACGDHGTFTSRAQHRAVVLSIRFGFPRSTAARPSRSSELAPWGGRRRFDRDSMKPPWVLWGHIVTSPTTNVPQPESNRRAGRGPPRRAREGCFLWRDSGFVQRALQRKGRAEDAFQPK